MSAPPGRNRNEPSRAGALWELARLFLRLGFTAFGGPAAHIALMQDEVVRRRGWLSQQEFLDLLGATNLIPGPNSTEMAIHIGHRRAGWPGLAVAGLSFILPATFIVLALAVAYVRLGHLPAVASALYAVKPVMVAIVLHALAGLGKVAIKSWRLGILAAVALGAVLAGVNELLILVGAGVAAAVAGRAGPRGQSADRPAGAALWQGPLPPGWALASAPVAVSLASAAPSSASLFLLFAKIGSVLFGSGYVLLAFVRAEFVHRRGWLSEAQLLDAIAVGQITPGPVFTTATFVGYLLGRTRGALAATAGIFLPAFFFVAVSGPLIPRIRRSPLAAAVLDGVNVASLALMAAVAGQLGAAALVDPITIALGLLSVLALALWRRLNPGWLVLAAALLGLLIALGGRSSAAAAGLLPGPGPGPTLGDELCERQAHGGPSGLT